VDFLCVLFGRCGHTKAKSFKSLIEKLEGAPRKDELVADLRAGHKSSRVVKRQPKVVSGHKELLLLISGGRGHHRHVETVSSAPPPP
jgi:hypothetical protein